MDFRSCKANRWLEEILECLPSVVEYIPMATRITLIQYQQIGMVYMYKPHSIFFPLKSWGENNFVVSRVFFFFCSDCETYLSADDLRINLWHMDVNDKSFNIVDIKPPNMEDLTEVITAAEFHPSHCHIFAYSSSKGMVATVFYISSFPFPLLPLSISI